MEIRMELLPGVTLTAVQTEKFKTGCFSINFFRPLRREEAAMNALIPSVLLRGSEGCPDLRAIAARLDELYGASAGTLIRKKGEVQMTGFYADFIEDALAGEPVFAPMMDFLGELLLLPRLENGAFLAEYVESEKRNLANAIASRVNDKRTYATGQLVKTMCAGEAYAVPRLGELEDVEPVTPEGLYAQYRMVLAESRVELFYMGRKSAEDVSVELKNGYLTIQAAKSKQKYLAAQQPTQVTPVQANPQQAARAGRRFWTRSARTTSRRSARGPRPSGSKTAGTMGA